MTLLTCLRTLHMFSLPITRRLRECSPVKLNPKVGPWFDEEWIATMCRPTRRVLEGGRAGVGGVYRCDDGRAL